MRRGTLDLHDVATVADPGASRDVRSFRNCHAGTFIVVCGCGVSARELESTPPALTIGVNDLGRIFHPTYLVVVNPRSQFSAERFQYIERSRAHSLFTHLALGKVSPPVVRFRLGRFAGTEPSGDALHYTQNSPYVAVCLAAYMGATRIGLIGVDFTEDHCFGPTGVHPLARKLPEIDGQYGRLAAALAERGVELVNLSRTSRLKSLPRAALSESQPRSSVRSEMPVRALDTPVSGRRLRVCIDNHHGGVIGALFDALAATASDLGHVVTRGVRARAHAADVDVVWNGRQYQRRSGVLYCEHGWLPRSAYQISPKGINADSHIAPFEWNGEPLSTIESAQLEAHLSQVRAECVPKPLGSKNLVGAPAEFLLVPLQMEFDTNIIRHAPRELRSMQALVDHVAKLAPPWPVIFKQHPADARRTNHHLRLTMRRRGDQLWPHSEGTVHELLTNPGCRGILTINSNVAHDGLLWDVPAIVLGRNVWPSRGSCTPFVTGVPNGWKLDERALAPEALQCRRAYASFLMRNQWTLADARDPERLAALLQSAVEPSVAHRSHTSRSVQRAGPQPTSARASLPVINVVAENRGWLFEMWKQRFRAIARQDLRLIVSERPSHNADAWIFIRAREAARTPDPVRTVVQIHDWQDVSAYVDGAERASVRECGAFSCSHAAQRDLLVAAGIPIEQRACAIQPVGFTPCTSTSTVPRSRATVAWVGRPAQLDGKDPGGLDFFAAAAALLGDAIRVVLIGERLNGYETRLRAAGVNCTVRSTKRYPLDTCSEWLREFDCVAITSETDSGPWPLFDALRAGVPVVSRPIGWARELLADGHFGRTAQDPQTMCEAIRQVIATADCWRRRSEELQEAVQAFSLDTWIEANLSLAMRLANGQPSAAGNVGGGVGGRVRLDVGCGEKCREGYIGVDVRALRGVSVVCNAWDLEQHFAPGTVDEIHSRHFLEHLTFEQGRVTLRAFRKVLREGGRLHIIVPDVLFHARQLLSSNPDEPCEASRRWTNRQHAIGSLWGWQRNGSTELWDVHKAGYDELSLRRALSAAGFSSFVRLRDRRWNLSLCAKAM
jgi:predicted SAM-dependent methyltransferase/glycosyltransferase involved in cell wall biosynthesis